MGTAGGMVNLTPVDGIVQADDDPDFFTELILVPTWARVSYLWVKVSDEVGTATFKPRFHFWPQGDEEGGEPSTQWWVAAASIIVDGISTYAFGQPSADDLQIAGLVTESSVFPVPSPFRLGLIQTGANPSSFRIRASMYWLR